MADRTDQDIEYLEGERGPVTVPQRRTRKGHMIGFVFIALVSIVGAALAYGALVKSNKPKEAKAQTEMLSNESTVPQKTFLPAPPAPQPPAAAGDQATVDSSKDTSRSTPEDDLQSRRLGSPLIPSGQGAQSSPAPVSRPADLSTEVGKAPGSLSAALVSTDTPPRAAGMITNKNLTIAKGIFIDCVLETRIDSTVPGMTSCVVTRNIYGDNGKVLLVERGSKITGEYQSGMQQGQTRIFVLWNRIKTVHGVTINLDSPGTDPLGGSGMPGYVNRHFGERFGAAILLSMIDDAFATAANLTQRSHDNQTIVYNSSSSNANQMAAEALRNTINIPPTLYKNQGERINVLVARDLSFEGVYDVTLQ